MASANLDIPKNLLKVAILPTAAGKESDYVKWIEWGISHFKKLGVEAYGVPVTNKSDANNSDFVMSLSQASIVYISGGDPDYLLSTLRKSKLLTEIFRLYTLGVPIVASSAGAMVLGEYTLTNPNQFIEGKQPQIWKKGVGLTKNSIIPHYNYIADNYLKYLNELISFTVNTLKSQVLGIEESTAVFQINDTITKTVAGKLEEISIQTT